MIICAGRSESFDFATPIGVGLIESAINLTKLVSFNRPDFLLFIGSAGSYGKYKVFDIVEANKASNIELGFLTNSAYTPLDNLIVSQNSFLKSDVVVNSSNYISTDEKLTKKFLNYNIDLENMEFFSVLSVAKEFNIEVAGIFVVTNYTNENAHEDFVKNHKTALDKLVKYLENKNIIKHKK